jgi:hypothetical protein
MFHAMDWFVPGVGAVAVTTGGGLAPVVGEVEGGEVVPEGLGRGVLDDHLLALLLEQGGGVAAGNLGQRGRRRIRAAAQPGFRHHDSGRNSNEHRDGRDQEKANRPAPAALGMSPSPVL